jgi:hypothetical protein
MSSFGPATKLRRQSSIKDRPVSARRGQADLYLTVRPYTRSQYSSRGCGRLYLQQLEKKETRNEEIIDHSTFCSFRNVDVSAGACRRFSAGADDADNHDAATGGPPLSQSSSPAQ